MDTDVLTEPELEPEDPPIFFSRRRMIRWVLILAFGILAVLAIWQEPLYAGH
jgi:hypothetical protein